MQNNAYLLGTCNYWCDKAFSAYEILSGEARAMFTCVKLQGCKVMVACLHHCI
jgi:hypothetical protein